MDAEVMRFTRDYFSDRIPLWEAILLQQGYAERECHLLEIGSFEGRSAVWMLENLVVHPLSTLTCIDGWEFGGEENFDHNMRACHKYLQVFKNKGRSEDILK